MAQHPRFEVRGSALLMVLWASAMMAITVLGIVEYVHYNMEETVSLEKNLRARQLAEAGIAVGLHPAVTRGDPVLTQILGTDEQFSVHLGSEGGRLNINTVVQNRQWPVLGSLCRIWGLTESETVSVSDDFKNWTPQNNWLKLMASQTDQTGTAPGFAMASQTEIHIPAHQFQSVEEMTLIPAMKLVAAKKPDWRNYFTVWSDGKLNMNEAPADLIAAVVGVSPETSARLVNARLGADGKPDTGDDITFKNLLEIRTALGLSPNDFAKIQDRLSLQDSVARIESTGTFGTCRRKIIVVVRRTSSPPIFLQWQEL